MGNVTADMQKLVLLAAQLMDCAPTEITAMQTLKLGMTNHSYRFVCRGEDYILRVPGEGTDKLINRRQEAAVYAALHNLSICDEIVALDPARGYKISRFYDNAHVCDPLCEEELMLCLRKLKDFHALALTVEHEFDIFGQIAFYESLWEGKPSAYGDYAETRRKVWKLKSALERVPVRKVLTHIDANPDNFLFIGEKDIRLIDWEYAGMQDPYVDIAMFAIYAMYDRAHTEHWIDLYFDGACPPKARARIYAYIAACGLLWSNWCEYKKHLGVDFGDYALCQYNYAREYAEPALRAMEEAYV